MVFIGGKARASWLMLVLVGGFLVFQTESKGLTDEQKEEFFKVAKQCATDSKLPEAELESMTTEKKPPQSKEGKCFIKCVMEKNEAITSNQVNKVGIEATLEEMIEDKAKLMKAKGILEECIKLVEPMAGGDSCEFAAKFGECVHGKMNEQGITGPTI